MLDGHRDGPITDGWRSTEVRDALDLCLACKGCKTDCPVNVDMATYKAEFLAHHYAGRLRPRGALRDWAGCRRRPRGRRPAPRPLVNRLAPVRRLARLGQAARPGCERPRPARASPTESLQQWWRSRPPGRPGRTRGTGAAVAGHLHQLLPPRRSAEAAVEVLEDGRLARSTIPTEPAVLRADLDLDRPAGDRPKRVLRRTRRRAAPTTSAAGGLVVGLEPSCTAVFRSDAAELLPDDQDVHRLRDQTVTFAELLTSTPPGWQPPRLDGTSRPSPRCTATSTRCWAGTPTASCSSAPGSTSSGSTPGAAGWPATSASRPATSTVSEACAEQVLLPAAAGSADAGTVVLADGFSCRTQIDELDSGGREAVHLAELLAAALDGADSAPTTPHDPTARGGHAR